MPGDPAPKSGGATPSEPFEWFKREGIPVVRVLGELDLYNSDRFRDCCTSAVDAGGSRLVVDLAAIVFMDSSAVGVMVRLSKQLVGDDGWLRVVCGNNARVRKLLDITGLTSRLGAYPTVEDAISA